MTGLQSCVWLSLCACAGCDLPQPVPPSIVAHDTVTDREVVADDAEDVAPTEGETLDGDVGDTVAAPVDVADSGPAGELETVSETVAEVDALASRKTLDASSGTIIVLDGDLAEWEPVDWAELAPPQDWVTVHDETSGPADLSARFAARWDRGHLWLAFDVVDDVQTNIFVAEPEKLWRGDCVQAAFDVGLNGGLPYDDSDDFEYGWALGATQQSTWRWVAPTSAAPEADSFIIVRDGQRTIYEIGMLPSDVGLTQFTAGRRIGFSVIIDDADNGERVGFLQWTPGMASVKEPGLFGLLVLAP